MPDGATEINTTTVVRPAQLIEAYIQLRDKKREVEARHKAELKPYNDMLEKLEAHLMEELDRLGISSMKSQAGTVFKVVRTSATVGDWGQALDYIRTHGLWEILEARVSKTGVLAVIEERREPVPGVVVTRSAGLNVRRA